MKQTFTKKPLSFFFAFVLSLGLSAQNIVPDPSFEDWDPGASTAIDYLGELYNWYSCNGSPDYHHEDHDPGNILQALVDCPLGNGDVHCGVAYHGEATLGIYKGNGTNGTKEWACAEFIEPMVEDECYVVSFQIQNKKDNPNFIAETSNWGGILQYHSGANFRP